MAKKKRIRVAWSPLSQKFYAFANWTSRVHEGREVLTVVGEKHDVTQDIAGAVVEHQIVFEDSDGESKR
jgi:hypothetical protein